MLKKLIMEKEKHYCPIHGCEMELVLKEGFGQGGVWVCPQCQRREVKETEGQGAEAKIRPLSGRGSGWSACWR